MSERKRKTLLLKAPIGKVVPYKTMGAAKRAFWGAYPQLSSVEAEHLLRIMAKTGLSFDGWTAKKAWL